MKILAKYTNEHSRFVVVNGSLIHYRDEGSGPTLLLLHGVFSSLHTFDAWTKVLSKKFRVLRFDLPGSGLSEVAASHEYSMKSYLSDVKQFLQLMGVDHCFMACSSFGGWVAWEFTLKYPKIIDKLTLIDAGGVFLEDKFIPLPFKMARTPIVNQIIKYVAQKKLALQFLYEVYGDPSKITPELKDRYYELFSRQGNPEAFLSLANGVFIDNTFKLSKIKHPTLIQWVSWINGCR